MSIGNRSRKDKKKKKKKKKKINSRVFAIFVYFEIRSNRFRMSLVILVVFVFRIRRIVPIFVAKTIRFDVVFSTVTKSLLETIIIHYVEFVVYSEDFELNVDVFLSIVLLEVDVVHFHRFQTENKIESIKTFVSFSFFYLFNENFFFFERRFVNN